jgi:hypothetical protein
VPKRPPNRSPRGSGSATFVATKQDTDLRKCDNLAMKQVGRGEGVDNPCIVRDAFCSGDNSENSRTKHDTGGLIEDDYVVRHSRLIEPKILSAYGFCHGEWGAVRTYSML